MKNIRIRKAINIALIILQIILLVTSILAIKYTKAIYRYTSIANLYFYDGVQINSYIDAYGISALCCIIIPLISFFIRYKHTCIKMIVFKTLIFFVGCFICLVILSNYSNSDSGKIHIISSPDNSKEIIVAETSSLLDMYVSIYEYADKNRNIIHRIYTSAYDTYYDTHNYYYHMEDNLYSIEWKENGLILDFLNYEDKSIENRIYLDYDY